MRLLLKLSGVLLCTALLAPTTACSDDSGTTPTKDGGTGGDGGGGFGACTAERADWKQCQDGKIQVCHIVAGMDPHFHWGTDCAALGLSCVNIDQQGKAACVDTSKTCSAADEKCDQNTAYFCVEGQLGQQPCGTGADCHASAGEAPHCEDKGSECSGHGHLEDGTCHCDSGYKVDPSDATSCVSEVDFEALACTEFAGAAQAASLVEAFADFDNAHVELDTPYQVTLPDGKASYVHFEVDKTGEYVIFLGEAGVFDSFMHRDNKDVAPAGGVPNGKCATEIKDHWHADLTMDGTGSATNVPYIARFKAIAGGKTVTFMIKRKDG